MPFPYLRGLRRAFCTHRRSPARRRRWAGAIASSSLGLTLLLAGCAPDLNWRETRVEGTDVSLTFPCRPARQQRQAQLAGQAVPLALYVCDTAGSSWALLWAPVAEPAAVPSALQALAAAARGNLGAAAAPPASAAVPGATPQPDAGRFLLQGRGPDGKPMAMAVLTFARGLQVFQVTVLGPAATAEPATVFFGSVRAGS